MLISKFFFKNLNKLNQFKFIYILYNIIFKIINNKIYI